MPDANPTAISGIRDNYRRGTVGGTVRFSFTHAKNTLSMFQKLSAGKAEPYKALCQWFDTETDGGRNMDRYTDLLNRAIRSVAQTYRKRVAAGLQSGRDFVIPDRAEQATGNDDFDLITWLVINKGANSEDA